MEHEPIFLPEILELLAPTPGHVYVDCTLGAGGHTEAILRAGASVIGLDRDPQAICSTKFRLAIWLNEPASEIANLRLVNANFRDLPTVLAASAIGPVDGLLLDLGVSSMQIERTARGFSFMSDGPLDMRMNQGNGAGAADLINGLEQRELSKLMQNLGDEIPAVANKIAAEILRHRSVQPITTTGELASIAERYVIHQGKRHPATRLFQALRIAVNDELGALAEFLNALPQILNFGGRLAIITFHSLEDNLVKTFFREARSYDNTTDSTPNNASGATSSFREIIRGPAVPSAYEQHRNPRARSAKLRAFERCA